MRPNPLLYRDECTCSGHGNEPNPCPYCQRLDREAEARDDAERMGQTNEEQEDGDGD